MTRRQITVVGHGGEQVLGYSASLLGDGATAVFFADLTDALAEEQRAAEAQRFAEVGRIASAMAHELKSPLATVELYANLMRRALAEDATVPGAAGRDQGPDEALPRPHRGDHALHQPRPAPRRAA